MTWCKASSRARFAKSCEKQPGAAGAHAPQCGKHLVLGAEAAEGGDVLLANDREAVEQVGRVVFAQPVQVHEETVERGDASVEILPAFAHLGHEGAHARRK